MGTATRCGRRIRIARSRTGALLNRADRHRGNSLVGILVTMAIIVVLFAVLMSSVNTAVTGAGNTTPGSVRSVQDQMQLHQIAVASFIAGQQQGLKGAPTPSARSKASTNSLDSTANIYSLLVAERYAEPSMLISKNERNPNVYLIDGYDWNAVRPTDEVYWDPRFKADLTRVSHVSYAHVPLCGQRARNWTEVRLDSRFPLLGTRGPAQGQPNPQSLTYGREGTWAGFQAFGDGHVDFTEVFDAKGLALADGRPDNAYAMDTDPDGNDAVLAFTQVMRDGVPTLQWD
jgi:competence protein ComGC